MKRLFAMLPLLAMLLTGCAAPNAATNESANTQQVEQNADSAGSKQVRPDRTKKENEPEGIAHFELNEIFQNLMDDVNAKHEAVTVYNGEYEQYLVQNKEPGFNFFDYVTSSAALLPDGSVVLTLEQVTEDMDIFYKTLRTEYGGYSYFGGDEVFRAAVDAVIADCSTVDTITVAALYNSAMDHFGFLKDQHFSINNVDIEGHEHILPFFFREIAYQKTEIGYATPGGKVVDSVDGYEDLDELFKLSLTRDGDLVYYPILLEPSEDPHGGKVVCDTILTVRYTDGSTGALIADDFYLKGGSGNSVDIREENGIPVITPRSFGSDSNALNFVKSAKDYKDRDIVMLDLRFNGGGNMDTVSSWFSAFTSHVVSANSLSIVSGSSVDPAWKKAQNHPDEEMVSIDNVCIMLSSKGSFSAAEWMIDCGWNMKNTLIVGENTSGGLTAYGQYVVTLPNSGIFLTFGPSLALHPEGHFEEYRGYYPDIWCPAGEAKEAVMNFIAKNTTVTYDQVKTQRRTTR